MWIELDDMGVPLGQWRWDDDEEEWVFDFFDVLLAAWLPQTDVASNRLQLITGLRLSMLLAGGAFVLLMKHKGIAKAKL